MIFIDWISTPSHWYINFAFFSNLPKNHNHKLFLFSKKLITKDINCVFKKSKNNRFWRFLDIVKICISIRNKPIFFLTYDPFFLPLIKLFSKKINTYKHNTVPEKMINKHAFFQYFFFKNITRYTQSIGQRNFLLKLKLNAIYLGSPLLNLRLKKKKTIDNCFIYPNNNKILNLKKKFQIFKNYKIYCKKILLNKKLIDQNFLKNILYVNYLKLDGYEQNILGIIFSQNSNIRVSGWFNQGIARNIPIIILTKKTRKLFIQTFPNHPYIFLDNIKNENHLINEIKKIKQFNSKKYIINHNRKFRHLLKSKIY